MTSGGDAETVDQLGGYGLSFIQKRHGYRFSVDPLILCDFVRMGEGGRIADLGTGCGVIPLLLAGRWPGATAVGIEHQEEMAALGRRNVELNGMGDRVTICRDDILRVRQHFPVSSFDVVTANPPYRTRESGRTSPRAGRDEARHESTAALGDFLSAAKYLVRPAGRIFFIHHPSRIPELLWTAGELKLATLRLRMVHDAPGAEARMVLVELAKGRKGATTVLTPLFIRSGSGKEYSEEMTRIMRGNGAC